MFFEQPRILERTTISVEDLTGRVEQYNVDLETDAVYNLKDDIYNRLNIDKNLVKINLLHNRTPLNEYITLKDAGLRSGSKLILVLALKSGRGGARKRKNKTRKIRKSNK